jgi:hypothetical protein
VITDVPRERPVTIPVAESIGATVVLLVVHDPPPVELASVEVAPRQALGLPVIEDGSGLTVMLFAALHPVGKV